MIRGADRIPRKKKLTEAMKQAAEDLDEFLTKGLGEVGSSVIVPKEGTTLPYRIDYNMGETVVHHMVPSFDPDEVEEFTLPEVPDLFAYLDAIEDGDELPDLDRFVDPVPFRTQVNYRSKGQPELIQYERPLLREMAAEGEVILLNPSKSAIYTGAEEGVSTFLFVPEAKKGDRDYAWQNEQRQHAQRVGMNEAHYKGDQLYIRERYKKKKDYLYYGGAQGHRECFNKFEDLSYLLPSFTHMAKTGRVLVNGYGESDVEISHDRQDRGIVYIGVPCDYMLTLEETSQLYQNHWHAYYYVGKGKRKKMSQFGLGKGNPKFPLYQTRTVSYSGQWVERGNYRVLKDGKRIVDIEWPSPYWVRRTFLESVLQEGEFVSPLGGRHVFDQDTWDLMHQDIGPRTIRDGLDIRIVKEVKCNHHIYAVDKGVVRAVPCRLEKEGPNTHYLVSQIPSGVYCASKILADIVSTFDSPKRILCSARGTQVKGQLEKDKILEQVGHSIVNEITYIQSLGVTEQDWIDRGFVRQNDKLCHAVPPTMMSTFKRYNYVELQLLGDHQILIDQLKKFSYLDIAEVGEAIYHVWNKSNDNRMYKRLDYNYAGIQEIESYQVQAFEVESEW